MSRRDYTIKELVDMIARGTLQLPEMQRQYVWTQTKVRDLLDSLYRGYPSGLILTWQTPQGAEVETRDFAVSANRDDSQPTLLLLDGQQRLTSLSSVLRGEPVTVRGRKTPVDILFNMDHPDELTFITEPADDADKESVGDEADLDPAEKVRKRAFVVSSHAILSLPNWVKVSDVFTKNDLDILTAAKVVELDGGDEDNLIIKDGKRYKRYTQRLEQLRKIRDYTYRAEELEPTKSYEEVTEIFVRVNSLGAKLRGSDLALAQITARWRGSLSKFTRYQSHVRDLGFDLDLGVHLRALIAIITGQSKFLTVSSLSRAVLEKGWERTKRVFDFAIDFTLKNLRIDSPALLSSPLLLITTAYWAHRRDLHIDPAEAAAFRRWFLIANAKGRYSRGSSETLLDQDLYELRVGNGVPGLMLRLEQQFGRLEVAPGDLMGRTTQSGLFKTMFLLFKDRGATDWATSLSISPKHANKADKIEFHHVFPQAFMRTARGDLTDRDINDIVNYAFIGSKTNKEISAKAPSEYRRSYPASAFDAQLIRFEEWGDAATDYEGFLRQRRAAVASALNEFFGLRAAES